jgi:hypothetical protein
MHFANGFHIVQVRRRAVVPSLHRKYLSTMVDRVFCRCSDTLVSKLEKAVESGTAVNMEAQFSQLTLDIIGLSVFNYEFNALKTDSPVIEAVYTALKETESRSTDILPYWQVSFLALSTILVAVQVLASFFPGDAITDESNVSGMLWNADSLSMQDCSSATESC